MGYRVRREGTGSLSHDYGSFKLIDNLVYAAEFHLTFAAGAFKIDLLVTNVSSCAYSTH